MPYTKELGFTIPVNDYYAQKKSRDLQEATSRFKSIKRKPGKYRDYWVHFPKFAEVLYDIRGLYYKCVKNLKEAKRLANKPGNEGACVKRHDQKVVKIRNFGVGYRSWKSVEVYTSPVRDTHEK